MYTGRGPVWGTIMRGKGGCSGEGAPGLAAIEPGGRGVIAEDGTAGGAAWTDGTDTGYGAAGGGVIATAGGGTGATTTGRVGCTGSTSLGGGASGGLTAAGSGAFATGGTTAGLVSTGIGTTAGRAGGTGGASGAAGACLRSRFNTSPGFEI